jgi:fatty acid desaturase
MDVMGIRFIPVDQRKFPYREPRQPRAPQAVRVRKIRYAQGFSVGAVAIVGGLIMLSLAIAGLWSVLLFVVALVGATLLGLWSISR